MPLTWCLPEYPAPQISPNLNSYVCPHLFNHQFLNVLDSLTYQIFYLKVAALSVVAAAVFFPRQNTFTLQFSL